MFPILFILLFLPFLTCVHSNPLFSEDEDPLFFQHVNVITGSFNLSFEDAVVEGAQSIPITRTYSSSGALERSPSNSDISLKQLSRGCLIQGGWNLFPHTNLLIEEGARKEYFKAHLQEPSGSMVSYYYSHKSSSHTIFLKPKQQGGQVSGKLSSRTNSQYNLLKINLKKGRATLFLPSGGKRIYQGYRFHKYNEQLPQTGFYHLDTEILPSGHQISYIQDQKTSHLKRIEAKNPSANKVYAAVDIDHFPSKKDKPFEINCRTSDGKKIHYKAIRFKERDYIHEVKNSSRPREQFHFVPGRKGTGARIASVELAESESLSIQYYLPEDKNQEKKWAEKPEKAAFHIDKVKTVFAPVGGNGEKVPIAHFSYYPQQTDVRDAEGLLIRYHYDKEGLTLIEYFNEKDELHSFQKFYWKESKLCCKALYDEKQQPLFAKTFVYDEGNIVEEVLWGSLTGSETHPLEIDKQGCCTGGESYRKQYSYYKEQFNLLKTEQEEEGPTYEYFYKPDTDLCTLKLTKDQEGTILAREFFIYNEDNLLVQEIIDDGSSLEPNDLRGVTERLEKRCKRNNDSGLPESLEESYLDLATQTLKHLKTIHYTYVNQKVHTEAVFDAENVHRYTLITDYNEFGQIKRKTTPSGKENTYVYNSAGNLQESKEVGSAKKMYTYDRANRLIAVEEPDTRKRETISYDLKGRILTQTDFRGNQTRHTYDCFGNRKTTELPLCKNEEEDPCTPTLTFHYDIQGNLTITQMPLEEKTVNTYTLFRKPTLLIQADGTQIRHFYNKNGTLKETYYPDGTQELYTYDLFKRQTSKTIYSSQGDYLASEQDEYSTFRLLSSTDPRGLKTTFSYNGAGQKFQEKAEDRTVTFSYDSLGFLEKTDNGVTALMQKHTVEGLIEEQWEEDALGRIENKMQFFYNAENRKETALRETSQGQSVDSFCYTDGKLSRHTDPHGHVTQFLWNEFFQNELGQQVLQKTVIDPLGIATIETYDAGDRIVCREKQDSEGKTLFKERFFYDVSGNLSKHITSIYADGTFVKTTDITWKYDAMGRVIEETQSGQKTTFYAYDSKGRLENKTLPTGVCLSYLYDGVDRLEELTSSDGSIHYHYTYENGPEPVLIRDLIQDTTLARHYNLFGQILAETNARGLTSQWIYDSIGRCTQFILPDHSSIAYPANGIHLDAVQRINSQGTLLYEHRYSKFDCNGHVTQEDRIFNLGPIQTTHDLLERPLSQASSHLEHHIVYGPSGLVTKTSNSLFGEKLYQHDALSQLKAEGKQTYAFDSLGNPTNFQINDLNQISATPECTLTYDENGNPKTRTTSNGSIEYQFDPLGRLTQITSPGKRKVLYCYDPLSRLTGKEIYTYNSQSWKKEQTLFYLYDGDTEIGTQDEKGNLHELRILGLGIQGDIGAAVALEIQGKTYAPLHDFKGNLIAIVSPSGNIIEKYEIDAFGKENTTSYLNPWRFSSKRCEEGLFFFGLRFYDPSLGRWLNPDPAGYVDGANLYVFVQNNPLNRLDLFGLLSEDPFGQIQIEIPIPVIPRLPGFQELLSKGSIGGVDVDFVVCCGHWHQLQFTPEEVKIGTVDVVKHLEELIPQTGNFFGLISVGNGIDTTLEECYNMSKAVGKKAGSTLLISLHNPTYGACTDAYGVGEERTNVETPLVCLTRQFIASMAERIYKINPQCFWLCLPHSRNGVTTKRAIEGMTEEQKQTLQEIFHIYALGPAEALPKSQGASVINVFSKRDYITGYGLFGYANKFKNNPDYDIRVISSKSKMKDKNFWIADHGFLKPTYRTAWKEHIKELKKETQFYGGSYENKR